MATDPKFDEMMARHKADMAEQARMELTRSADLIAQFKDFAASRGIQLNDDSFDYIQTIGIVACAPRLAKAILGPIRVDRDGLFSYTEISERASPSAVQAGYFVGNGYMLMADSCYRRGMKPNANWAPKFLDLFWGLNLPRVEKYISIDEDLFRINVDGSAYFEADTWYGAPFDEDIRNIKPGTVKLRPPLDLKPSYIDFFFANAYCLDIKWTESDGIKTFQALEIKTEDVQVNLGGVNYFPARYLHAEFDLEANCFRHFDGAVQFFTKDEYLHRREFDFNLTAKSSEHIKARSRKVFKLNGPLTTDVWVELCCHFYAANPLTFEYFTGAYPAHLTDTLHKIRSHNS